jgi:hypothetical protein
MVSLSRVLEDLVDFILPGAGSTFNRRAPSNRARRSPVAHYFPDRGCKAW